MKYIAVLIKDPGETVSALKYQLSELFGEAIYIDINNLKSTNYENSQNHDLLFLEAVEQLAQQNRQLNKLISQYAETIKEHRLKERTGSDKYTDLSEIRSLIENFERDLQENERQIQLLSFETDRFKEENFNLKNQLISAKETILTKESQITENQHLINQLKREIDILSKLSEELKNNTTQLTHSPAQGIPQESIELQEKVNTLETFIEIATRQIIDLDKMASLGRIVAGVAHEINTPIGAINASSDNILKIFQPTLRQLPQILKHLAYEDENTFFELIEKSLQFSGTLSSREERQHKKNLLEELESMGVADANSLASQLVKIGIFADLQSFERIFKLPQGAELLEQVSNIGKIKLSLDNTKLAISKIIKIVQSLKSYSHHQVSEEFIKADISANMEVVLNIHHNQLKYGVEVIKNYVESAPMIWCRPDELNQVWTNIIYNAIQAMDGKGTLWIDIEPDTNQTNVVVRITDSGPGIPEDILPKIFNPFFTTKPQGEGSGLGLDICKKIIEKHHGTISVNSVPGKTCFTITLPVNPKDQP
ncbi:MAG: GHKL domain-containing protein [Bacteroidia bacterium]|nr:GHKL domain-containing protein [Bacteroidia bacterium]